MIPRVFGFSDWVGGPIPWDRLVVPDDGTDAMHFMLLARCAIHGSAFCDAEFHETCLFIGLVGIWHKSSV